MFVGVAPWADPELVARAAEGASAYQPSSARSRLADDPVESRGARRPALQSSAGRRRRAARQRAIGGPLSHRSGIAAARSVSRGDLLAGGATAARGVGDVPPDPSRGFERARRVRCGRRLSWARGSSSSGDCIRTRWSPPPRLGSWPLRSRSGDGPAPDLRRCSRSRARSASPADIPRRSCTSMLFAALDRSDARRQRRARRRCDAPMARRSRLPGERLRAPRHPARRAVLLPFVENLRVSTEWVDRRPLGRTARRSSAARRARAAAARRRAARSRRSDRGTWRGPENLAELGGAATGGAALFLATLGLIAPRASAPDAGALLSIAGDRSRSGLAVGAHMPIVSRPIRHGFRCSRTRSSSGSSLWWVLAVAILAAAGTEAMRRSGRATRRRARASPPRSRPSSHRSRLHFAIGESPPTRAGSMASLEGVPIVVALLAVAADRSDASSAGLRHARFARRR